MTVEAFLAKNKETSRGTEVFKTKEGDTVTLRWNVCQPREIEKSRTHVLQNGRTYTINEKQTQVKKPDKAVLFLPGVAVEADTPAVIQSAQDFADASQTPTFSISTRIDNPKSKNYISAQAEAINAFIAQRGLKELTFVANSAGVKKAHEVIFQLERDGTQVEGLIMTNPGGLYEQDPNQAITNFTKDGTIKTPAFIIKQGLSLKTLKLAGKALGLGNSIAGNVALEALRAPTQFTTRAKREAEEAATVSPHAAEIKAPIVIVFGTNDIVFNSHEVIPDDAHTQSKESQQKRIAAVRKIFPKSKDIRVLEAGGKISDKEPEKFSNHGTHYLRNAQVANASIQMLKRMEQNGKAA